MQSHSHNTWKRYNKYPSWKQAKLKVVEVFWEKCKENTSLMGSSLFNLCLINADKIVTFGRPITKRCWNHEINDHRWSNAQYFPEESMQKYRL